MNDELAYGLLSDMGQRVPSKLIDFGRALESYLSPSQFEWPYFLEKPHKWASEYAAWANCDYPQDSDEAWAEFYAAMETFVND